MPTWGLASIKISSGAPQDTSVSRMNRWRGSRVPVFSLPSEKAPAPPSPNWTLEVRSSSPVAQNRSTSAFRRSTGRPRSSRMGRSPARASTRAAKSPAGPAPTTTGGTAGAGRGDGGAYAGACAARLIFRLLARRRTADSSLTATSTV